LLNSSPHGPCEAKGAIRDGEEGVRKGGGNRRGRRDKEVEEEVDKVEEMKGRRGERE